MQIVTAKHVVEAGIAVSGTSFLAAAAWTNDQMVTAGVVIAGIISAVSAGAVAIINALVKRQEALIKAMDLKVTNIETKAAVIEGHVNSEKTRNTALIESQRVQMTMLQDTIVRMDIAARLLAQQAAAVPTVVAIAPVEPKEGV